MAQWKDNPFYKQKANKIYGLYGEYDYVHPLGNSVVPPEHQFYLNYNENSLRDQDSKIESFHALYYLFCADSEHHFIAQLEANGSPSEMVKVEQDFMREIMQLSPDKYQELAKALMTIIWKKPSPDGETGEWDWDSIKSIFVTLGDAADSSRAEPLKEFFFQLLLNLGAIRDKDDSNWKWLERIFDLAMAGSFINNTISYIFGYDPDAYQKQVEANLSAAGAEAAEHPEFWIDPEQMLMVATNFANLGEDFRSVATGLKQVAQPIPFRYSGNNPAYGSEMNAKIRAIENQMAVEANKINQIAEVMLVAAAEALIDCIPTINGTLAYLRDTGNHFQQLEDNLKQGTKSWENSILKWGM